MKLQNIRRYLRSLIPFVAIRRLRDAEARNIKLRAAGEARLAELKTTTDARIAAIETATDARIASLTTATNARIATLKTATGARIAELEKLVETWRQHYMRQIEVTAHPRALNAPARTSRVRITTAPFTEAFSRAKPEPVVSFVLASYERLAFLKETIASVREQALGVPYEIVVVDGGSRDGTVAWLTAQTDIVSIIQHNRVPEEGMKRRRTWGYFINLAFRAAKGKWLCMLSDDCVIVPGCISNGLQHVEELEAAGRPIGGGAFYFRNWPAERRYFVQHTLGGMLMVNHGFFLREALADVGYAEERVFDFYKADSDLALKLWHAGYEIVACPDSFIEHFMLPTEAIRMANVRTLDDDRDRLAERWEGIFGSRVQPSLFKPPYQDFSEREDSTRTADRFLPLMGEGDLASFAPQ